MRAFVVVAPWVQPQRWQCRDRTNSNTYDKRYIKLKKKNVSSPKSDVTAPDEINHRLTTDFSRIVKFIFKKHSETCGHLQSISHQLFVQIISCFFLGICFSLKNSLIPPSKLS